MAFYTISKPKIDMNAQPNSIDKHTELPFSLQLISSRPPLDTLSHLLSIAFRDTCIVHTPAFWITSFQIIARTGTKSKKRMSEKQRKKN